MSKNSRADDALWMSALQMFQGGDAQQAAAVAATALSDVQRDGKQQSDFENIVKNTIYAENNDPWAYLFNILDEHPNMEDDFEEFLQKSNIVLTDRNQIPQVIASMLKVRGYGNGGQFENIDNFIDVKIKDKTFHLLHLVTEEQKEKGLMDVESMELNEGALFDYSNEPQASLDFWMHDTSIPLDIIFVNEKGIVISVKQGIPETDDLISESSEFIAYVIEVNTNSGIKPGDKTSLGETIEETDPDEDESLEDEYPDLQVNHLVVYGSDGQPQGFLKGNERIFSRKSTRVIIRKAKRAYKSQSDTDFKALGRYVFNEMKAQDNREPEYTE